MILFTYPVRFPTPYILGMNFPQPVTIHWNIYRINLLAMLYQFECWLLRVFVIDLK